MDTTTKVLSIYERATETATYLKKDLADALNQPKIAIICGSGLGGLADTVNAQPKVAIPYSDVPNFPISTVHGHAGQLVFATMGSASVPVMIFVGRVHFYEGHSMEKVTFMTRVCKVMGVETMIVTNAAGGLNPSYNVGDIAIINDHLNFPGFAGTNPLIGPNDENFGVRFPPLSDAYDLHLRRLAHTAWQKLNLSSNRTLHEGTYALLAGPTYETRAECRMLRMCGADLVGMSTVPEIIVARHCGMRVLAFSLVTNQAVLEAVPRGDDPAIQGLSVEELTEYLSKGKANHEEVLEAGRAAAKDMQELVKCVVQDLYG